MRSMRSVSRFSEAVGACTVMAATGVGVAGLSATPASAAIVGLIPLHTVQAQSYSFTKSVTDTKGTTGQAGSTIAGSGATYTGNVLFGSKTFNYFNPSNGSAYDGVLTGAAVSIGNITRAGNSSVTGVNASSGSATANLSGSFKTNITGVPGLGTLASVQSGTITNSVTRASGSSSPTNGPTNFNLGTSGATNPSVNIDDFIAAGTYNIDVNGNVSATTTTNNARFGDTSSSTINATASGNLSVDYTYFYHATPSFSSGSQAVSLDVNFGNVTQGSGVLTSVFSLYNLPHDGNSSLAINTIDLGFNNYNSLGDDTVLTVTDHNDPYGSNPVYFNSNNSDTGDTELSAGASRLIDANLFTGNAPGHYAATYYLYLSDDTGATAADWINTTILTLTLEADILVGASSVPEPVTSSMFGAGLAGLFFIRRRKKRGGGDAVFGPTPLKPAA